MRLNISGLHELRERLERLRPEEVMARALAEQAARMAARVRDGLSEPPDAAGHDEPWLRSGALRDSVGAQADGLQAAVGSSDPAAVPQELGTAHMPARPFLAPVAAEMGEEVARALGAAVAAAIKGDSTDAAGTDTDLSGDSLGGSNPPNWSGAAAGASLLAIDANATGVGGLARSVAGRSNTDGFKSSGIQLTGNKGTPGNNQAQNKQFRDVVVRLGSTPGQADRLHREISGENSGFQDILQIGREMFDE